MLLVLKERELIEVVLEKMLSDMEYDGSYNEYSNDIDIIQRFIILLKEAEDKELVDIKLYNDNY